MIGAQSFKEDSGLRNELLIVEKPLDRDGSVENNPHALMRSVSKLAQVRKRPWESAVLSPDLVAKGLNASEERVLGPGAGLSGESLDEILHLVLKGRGKGLDFLEEFGSAHGFSRQQCYNGAAERATSGDLSPRLDSFVADDAMSVGEAGQHIVTFQTRARAQEIVHAVAGRQHSENMLDRQAVTAKGRLPTEDFRVYGDSFEQQGFSHVDSNRRIIAKRTHQRSVRAVNVLLLVLGRSVDSLRPPIGPRSSANQLGQRPPQL